MDMGGFRGFWVVQARRDELLHRERSSSIEAHAATSRNIVNMEHTVLCVVRVF